MLGEGEREGQWLSCLVEGRSLCWLFQWNGEGYGGGGVGYGDDVAAVVLVVVEW